MTTPTTLDLAAIAERCAEEIMDNHSKSKSIHVLEALTEAVAPLLAEVQRLQQWIHDCQSGMYINCVYCGHRYGPDDGNHLVTMQDALRAHIEKCPKHPMSKLQSELTTLRADKLRLDLAILYPRRFLKLMETRAHGGFPDEELKQGRIAIDSAIQNEKGKE